MSIDLEPGLVARPTKPSELAPRPEWGEPRSRTVTWFDPTLSVAAGATLSGMEVLGAIRVGELPPPPMASLFDFQILELEPGRVVFGCEPEESAYNPLGMVHGGLVCTLADTVAGCAVHSTLPAGVAYTSIDLNVSYLRPVTRDSGLLWATGLVTKAGRRVAFANAEIVDASGRSVATATSSLLIIDSRAG